MKKQLVSLVTLAVLAFAPAWAEPQQEPPQQPPQQTVEVVQAEAPQEELQRPAQQEPLEVDQNQKSRDFSHSRLRLRQRLLKVCNGGPDGPPF